MKTIKWISLLISTLLYLPVNSLASSVCGPGINWISTCSTNTTTYNVDLFFGIDTDVDFNTDMELSFSGTVVIASGAPFASDPTNNPGYNDVVITEILSMDLVGSNANAAGWSFKAGINQGLSATNGFIGEAADTTSADIIYQMVFEIYGTPYGTLHHNGTFFFAAIVDQSPALNIEFKHTGGPIGGTIFELYDDTNTHVVNMDDLFDADPLLLTAGRPNFVLTSSVPLPATLPLILSGLCLIGAFSNRENNGIDKHKHIDIPSSEVTRQPLVNPNILPSLFATQNSMRIDFKKTMKRAMSLFADRHTIMARRQHLMSSPNLKTGVQHRFTYLNMGN